MTMEGKNDYDRQSRLTPQDEAMMCQVSMDKRDAITSSQVSAQQEREGKSLKKDPVVRSLTKLATNVASSDVVTILRSRHLSCNALL
jgi:hypothetical protein